MKKILIFTILLATLLFPAKVFAASASFSTSGGGTVYVGNQFNVSVSVYGSDPYNAVTVNVAYSNLIFVGATAAAGWTGVSGPSNSGNTVSYSGALLGSTATGSRSVLNLTFRAVNSPATGTIHSTGQIALADGNGTKVDAGGNTVTYNITTPPPAPDPVPEAVTITSSSHPNPTAWYSSKSIIFFWSEQESVDNYSYILDTKSDTVPDDNGEGKSATFSSSALVEGINYFHVKAHNSIGWGPVTHFEINIDTQSPDPFQIAKLTDPETGKYIIYFATNDAYSGVANFNVEIDGVDMGEQASGYKVDKNVGKVVVTAFDKAGNKLTAELVINEGNVPVEKPTETPFVFDLKTALITLGIILGLGLLLGLLFVVYKKLRKRNSTPKTETVITQ